MNKKIVSDLKKMIDVNTPIIYIDDYDFTRIDFLLFEALGTETDILEWSPALGMQRVFIDDGYLARENYSTGIDKTLDVILKDYLDKYKTNKPIYLVLKDVHGLLDDISIKSLVQMIAQRKLYDLDFDVTLIINSSIINVPKEIEKYVSFLDIPFPSDEEIRYLIKEHVETNHYEDFHDNVIDKLMPSLKGMTLFEIDRMLDMAMSSGGTLKDEDKDMILRHKKQMVKKSGVLELVDSPESLDSIGGLENLKKYLTSKSKVIKDIGKAIKAGVAVPKGVFIVGMPGCGKSLCAKATAALFECPLLQLDMGSLMGKYLGESEKNLRQAIKIAEAVAPCVLWIDEIEKAFTGVGESEVLTRMFGHLLLWLQEKTSSVYVLATSNNANNLPPELKRKGRFDEIFCVNLPTYDEREKIFNVHLKKRKDKGAKVSDSLWKDGKFSVPKKLIDATEGFNGADIESVINEAVSDCFINEQELSEDILLEKAKETVSISKSCKKQIEEMEKIFKDSNFKNAS